MPNVSGILFSKNKRIKRTRSKKNNLKESVIA